MKTWKYRLMSGYLRREVGASKLLSAHSYLTRAMTLQDLDRPKFSLNDPAPKLLWDVWLKDGNFYRKHQAFPAWRVKVENLKWAVKKYFSELLGAILGRDLHEHCND